MIYLLLDNDAVYLLLQIAISPNQKFIVTAGTEGAIFIWDTPPAVAKTLADDDMPEATGHIDTLATGGPRPANAPA